MERSDLSCMWANRRADPSCFTAAITISLSRFNGLATYCRQAPRCLTAASAIRRLPCRQGAANANDSGSQDTAAMMNAQSFL
eukprot:CAMPEP_0172733388 /NCGR_PEP_ID=MMETSP1074-20121228/107041_1 /TAXON_ID=2916 /ORGANISM="Ceratium fusus, Strain PA161109" /LENGTH=81 /DNA_ID=CAMNT_0013561923 /DNA_START=535 /DNA_END=780 /DNA_ORIENTATION=-